MAAKWSAMTAPKGSLLHNDAEHGFSDPNQGGGPTKRTVRSIPPARRGGSGHHGQRGPSAPRGGGRAPSGNPASRGGNVGSFTPESRIPGHGGSPQHRGRVGTGAHNHGGFGHSGQKSVPSYPHSNPRPGPGNVSGRMHRRIAGEFRNFTKGRGRSSSADTGTRGSWGSPPVDSNV